MEWHQAQPSTISEAHDMWSAIFADHEMWHTVGENIVWVAGALVAFGIIWKNNLIGRPIKWVWKRLVSEPVSHWSKNLIGDVVEEKIDNSPAIKKQENFQKRVDDSIAVQDDYRHEIKREVRGITAAQAKTTEELSNIHSCLDRRFTETQAQIDRITLSTDRVLLESSGNRERIRQMYDLQDSIVFETDASGNFTYFNPAFTIVTGLASEDALGLGWSFSIHPEDQPRVFRSWADARKRNIAFTEIFRMLNVHSDEYHTVRAVAQPLRDGTGAPVGWIGTATILSPAVAATTLAGAEQNSPGGSNG